MKNQTFFYELYDKVVNKWKLVDLTAEIIHFILKLFICILLYYLFIKILKKLKPLISRHYHTKIIDCSLKSFISSIFNIGLHAFMVMVCLLILGVKESSLIAFFGTLGIGIGLALKDNLSNVSGGVIILLFKTYKLGDEVSIADTEGFVHSIDIYSTNIRTYYGDIVAIPNGLIVSNKIINYTKTPARRLVMTIGISYDADIDLARKQIETLLKNNPLIIQDRKIYSYVSDYANSSINITLRAWVLNENYWQAYQDIQNELKKSLDSVKISIPYPQLDIFIKNTAQQTTSIPKQEIKAE